MVVKECNIRKMTSVLYGYRMYQRPYVIIAIWFTR